MIFKPSDSLIQWANLLDLYVLKFWQRTPFTHANKCRNWSFFHSVLSTIRMVIFFWKVPYFDNFWLDTNINISFKISTLIRDKLVPLGQMTVNCLALRTQYLDTCFCCRTMIGHFWSKNDKSFPIGQVNFNFLDFLAYIGQRNDDHHVRSINSSLHSLDNLICVLLSERK